MRNHLDGKPRIECKQRKWQLNGANRRKQCWPLKAEIGGINSNIFEVNNYFEIWMKIDWLFSINSNQIGEGNECWNGQTNLEESNKCEWQIVQNGFGYKAKLSGIIIVDCG